MRTIYIDILIFTNIFQDFLLLLGTKRILHIKASYTRILIGSLVGGITSLVALLPDLNFLLSIFIKILIALILVLISFGFHSKVQFTRSVMTLFILSFLTSGALICFYLAIKPDGMAVVNNVIYFNISPVLLIILTFIIYFILLLYKKLFKNHSAPYEIVDVALNNKYHIKCKIDSGCVVKEPFSGSYVIIIEEDVIKDIKPDISKMRVIPFESLGGDGIIYGFRADDIEINHKKVSQEIYIGLCNNIFRNEYKGIVPQMLVKD